MNPQMTPIWVSCIHSGMSSDPRDVERCLFLGLSLEELGMRALSRLPRDKAIDGIRAFNEMRFVTASIGIPTSYVPVLDPNDIILGRDRLMSHLRPIAQEGREVTEDDIKGFFSEKMATKGSE